MKRGLFFLLFMVAFIFKGFSQSTPADSTEMYDYIDSVLAEARGPIKRTDFFNLLTTFNSYMALQGVNGTGLLSAGDTALMLTPYINRSDTAAMLASYTRYVEFLDSVSDLRADLGAGALQLTDTAAMLQSYIQRSDTASMLTPYINRADTAIAFAPFIERNDTASMLSPYRRKNDLVVATDYTGISNDGTSISQANFSAFITATNGRRVFWPAGTYQFAAGAVDINPTSTDIYWTGEGENTVLENFDDFSPQGDYLVVRDMKFKNSDYLFRYDASETAGPDTSRYVEFSDLFVQRVKGITRYPETAEQWVHHIKFDNIIYDTIAEGGVGISVNGGAGVIECTNLYFNGTVDSSAISLLSLSSEQDGGRGVDTAIYVDNIVINNFWVREGLGTAANYYNIYAEAQEGSVIKVSNVKIANTNLPLIYLRGSTTTIFDNIDIRTDTLRSDFVGPVIICKSPGTDQRPAMIVKNSHIDVPDITAIYKENPGNTIIENNYIKVNGASKFCFNVSHNTAVTYDWAVRVQGNTMINASAVGPLIMNIPAYVKTLEVFDNRFFITNVQQGSSAIQVANANVGATMINANFQRNYFYNARLTVGAQRYLKILNFQNNQMVAVGVWGLNAQEQAIIKNNLIQSLPIDSGSVTGCSGCDWAIDFSGTRAVYFQNNTFNFSNARRMYNIDFSQYGANPDTVIFSGNRGTINAYSLNSSYAKLMRIDQVGYLKVADNEVNFANPAGTDHVIFLEDSIGYGVFENNNFSANGQKVGYMVEGLSGSTIGSVRYFNNSGVEQNFETSDITVTYDSIKSSQIYDLSGNAYLTEADTAAMLAPYATTSAGWAHYIDTAYATAADSFYVAQGSTLTLPIKADMTAALVTNYLPNGVDSLFSQNDSTILGITTGASYTVRISFKAKNSNNTGYATIAFDIGTGGTPNITSSETFVFPKGAGVETQESKTILLYSLDTFVANGCKIKVTADTGNLEIYDIRLLIRLDSRP